MTRAKFAPWVRRLQAASNVVRLSVPALETLAVIAYRQPVLRADVEAIRGVQCGEILRQLMERGLIRIVGRSEELGRPLLYGTTRQFLQVFGLRDLDQLPRLAQNVLPQAILIDQTANDMAVVNVEGLAKDCGLPNVPFLVCPLPGEEPLRQRLDVDGYLIKPVTRPDLWGVLRRFGKGVDHILIVDDDPDFVRLIRRMLEDPVQRYHMTACYSGREALEKLCRRPPDLLLLDLILPDVSGVEVIAQMRSHSELSRIPVVVVSGEEDIDGQRMLHGSALFTKGEGLTSTEVIHWLQSVLDVDDTGWKGVET